MSTLHIHPARQSYGVGSRTAAPTATPGSLLEMIQLARQQVAGIGGSGYDSDGREPCLRAAEEHAARLDRIRAREGLRAYVIASPSPWDALWLQIAAALGIATDQPRKAARTLRHAQQVARRQGVA